MKKIPSLFKRTYDGDHLVYDKVVEGCEWVIAGEGEATEKFDGTACMVRDGVLYKRYDRKPTKSAKRRHVEGEPWEEKDLKAAPNDWEPCESKPDLNTGHWPGWVPVRDGPEDKYHREAWEREHYHPGTYELVGPKVQGNLYDLEQHELWEHGCASLAISTNDQPPRNFIDLKDWFQRTPTVEGIVWHHPDGHMCKIKRRDFGLK